MWFFIIIGIVIFLLIIKKSSGEGFMNQETSSTKELTVADIREYYPYMDRQLAAQYKIAIMQGQYSFKVGKGLIEQWDRNRFSKNSRTMQNDNITIPTSEYTNVTWWKLQQYFPIMDSEMSANYLAEYLIDDSKPFMVKTALLKEWDEKLAEYKNIGSKLQQTADNNNKGIAFEKEGNITSAIEVYEENLKIGYPAIHSYIRLMILYRKAGDLENEKRVINSAIKTFTNVSNDDVQKFEKRLAKLEEGYTRPNVILPKKATIYHSESKPLGILYEEVKLRFKEFDFYNSGEDRSSSFLNDNNRDEIWAIQNKFKQMIANARNAEEQGRLDKASTIYEKLLFEEYYLSVPYDRLIKIYSKSNLINEEKRVLELSINHFTELKNRQLKYIFALAKKYDRDDFVKDKVDNEKKISYYGGAFELYNPYPIIKQWQERLNKLMNK